MAVLHVYRAVDAPALEHCSTIPLRLDGRVGLAERK